MSGSGVPEAEVPCFTSVVELMELLCGSPDDRALRTAALLRRSHPADKELQLAGLLHDVGRMLRPGDGVRHAVLAAQALRPLLGDRVARLVRAADGSGGPGGGPDDAEAVATLRRAREGAGASGPDAGVLEDWRPLLELVAAGSCRAANVIDPLGPPRGSITRTG
ncbi:HD domain-containing protein [Streptomyces sp. NPDC090021]|uniref:HD domain-containing protein n=1 Tax=Streptomyces sp. NPDC090021 TaxID=3365919 RepID=UPI00383051C5